jgi:serine/threonine protein kinase
VADALPTVLSRYRVLSLLGSGGMGEVYLASDDRLGRRVAIKILPDAVSRDEEAKLRMLREARAVAALDHPNVCTVYEVGEHEGRPYIVMQFVEGETLFDRLRQARMSSSEVLDVATQVVAALDEAHSHGIIHRDVKPMNIMLTPRGQVKVLDFGLAKFTSAREHHTTDHLESRAGIITGTAPYMSPEQLRGAPIDARSDIFSLGVVLYEMVTGRRPFERTSTVATITAILFEEPDPIDEPGFSPFLPVVRRALAKEPSKRYSTAAQMLDALNDIKSRPRATPRPRSTEHEVTERNVGRASARPSISRSGRIDSLAVLPSVSGNLAPSLEYLVYGLSEGIVNALAHVKKLRVIAPGTAAQYAGTDPDPREAGRELNVAGIVVVRARVDGDLLHADVDLVSTADGSLLWSSRYVRPVREIASLSESIADDLAERVRGSASAARRPVKKKRAVDAEAEQLHLKGRFQWIKRHPEAVKQAMTFFQQAVERDPSFALPYAGLADCFVMLGFMQALPPREILPKVKAAARRAIELDPLLADPHATLGYAAGLFEWDFETGQRELEEAMRLNPNYPWAPHWLGILMCGRGHVRRALELIDMSKDLDPLSPIINVGAGIPLHIAKRYDDAVNCYRAVLETDPGLAPGHYYLGMSLEMRGDYDDAIRAIERAIEIAGPAPIFVGALAHVFASASRPADAERLIEQLRGMVKQRYVSPYSFAIAHTGLGQTDLALAAIEQSLEEHNAWMCFLPIDPRFDTLRQEPRFVSLVERYGLPARVETDA